MGIVEAGGDSEELRVQELDVVLLELGEARVQVFPRRGGVEGGEL